MKHLIGLLTLQFFSIIAFGQDYRAEFGKHFQEGDTAKQLEALKSWESKEPKNPELFTSYFNFYFQKSKEEILSLGLGELEGEALSILDSAGNPSAYIGTNTYYNPDIFKKGIQKIDEGILLYPNRLDMRFGKIYAFGEAENWKAYTEEIVSSIQYSNKNNNHWTWTENEKQENGKEFFLSSLQDYQVKLYNTGNDTLLENMKTIALEVLKFYPNNIESLSNLSITYLLTDQYDKAIEPLLKAEKIDPEDAIVLGNIAQAYKLKGDKETSIKYYEKAIQYADEDFIEFAKQQILELTE